MKLSVKKLFFFSAILILILLGFIFDNEVMEAADISSSWLIIQVSGLTAPPPAISCTTPMDGSTTTFPTLYDADVYTSSPNTTTTASTTNAAGMTITIYDIGENYTNPGLYKSDAPTDLIGSADASYNNTSTLQAGVEGYGLQATTSGPNLNIDPRFLWTGNNVGGLEASSTNAVILASSSTAVADEVVTIILKAAVSVTNLDGDYSDGITITCTAN